jgi:O-antigen/teichoic acid export membrane protein
VLGDVPNRVRWNAERASKLITFGRWVFVCSLVNFLAGQSDRLILGKLLGDDKTVLGIYSIAVSWAMLPQVFLTALSMSLIFPILSSHARRSEASVETALRPIRDAMLMAGVGIVLGVFVESEILFGYVYNANYQMAIPISRLMSVVTWIGILGLTVDPALYSLGDTRGSALATLGRFLVMVPASLLGYHFAGLWGFIVGLWVGGVLGQTLLLLKLSGHHIRVWKQDVVYSGVLLLLMAAVWSCQSLHPVLAIAVPQVILAAVLAFVAYNLLKWVSAQRELKAASDS